MSVSQKRLRDERHIDRSDPEYVEAVKWLAAQLWWEDLLAGLHARKNGRRRPPCARDAA